MVRKSRSSRRGNRRIALERVLRLFHLSRGIARRDPKLAQRYIDLARGLGMRYKVKLPLELRRAVCKRCKVRIVPGANCRIRIQQRREPHVVYTCLNCGGLLRIPLNERRQNTTR
jgi:ribonuclease P protein subunit RPR2